MCQAFSHHKPPGNHRPFLSTFDPVKSNDNGDQEGFSSLPKVHSKEMEKKKDSNPNFSDFETGALFYRPWSKWSYSPTVGVTMDEGKVISWPLKPLPLVGSFEG